MGKGQWFGSDPIRVRFASPRARDPLAPIEGPKSVVSPIQRKATRKRRWVSLTPQWPLPTRLRLRRRLT